MKNENEAVGCGCASLVLVLLVVGTFCGEPQTTTTPVAANAPNPVSIVQPHVLKGPRGVLLSGTWVSLDGGTAVALFSRNRPKVVAHYWINGNSVYAVNATARSWSPKLEPAPAMISGNRVKALLAPFLREAQVQAVRNKEPRTAPAPKRGPTALSSPSPQQALPLHQVVSNTNLLPKNGRRIEIHSSDPELNRDECRTLIFAYQEEAAPDGQVSVHKPNAAMGGDVLPWCVENFDGQGVIFNDLLFR